MSGPHPVAHLKAEQAVLAELSNSPVNAVNVRQHVDMIRGPPRGPTPPPGSAYGLRRDHSQCAAEVHQRLLEDYVNAPIQRPSQVARAFLAVVALVPNNSPAETKMPIQLKPRDLIRTELYHPSPILPSSYSVNRT